MDQRLEVFDLQVFSGPSGIVLNGDTPFIFIALFLLLNVTQLCAVLQGAPLSCLWFGPVYFGTSRLENVVLRNNAPQACDWVCLLQDTAAGTEVVSKALRHSCYADRHSCV